MKRTPRQDLQWLLKIKKLEKEILQASEADLAEFENNYEERTFCKIQKLWKTFARPQQSHQRLGKAPLLQRMELKYVSSLMTTLWVDSGKTQKIMTFLLNPEV